MCPMARLHVNLNLLLCDNCVDITKNFTEGKDSRLQKLYVQVKVEKGSDLPHKTLT